MKLHKSVIERLIKIFTTYGGYPEELKLQKKLEHLDMSIYQRQNGQEFLVLTAELTEQKK